jgi:hypothetical protein
MKLIPLIAVAYSHGILPTVTIVRDGTHVRINESDFDPETMELADEPSTDETVLEPTVTTEPQQPAQLIVMKQGRKFFIADLMGQKVEGEAAAALGIADTGYGTEAEATAALAAIAPQG